MPLGNTTLPAKTRSEAWANVSGSAAMITSTRKPCPLRSQAVRQKFEAGGNSAVGFSFRAFVIASVVRLG